MSKLFERAVSDQLLEHVMKMGKLEDLQATYRSGHSTETALLKVKTDILDTMDKQRVTCLVLLDLSAAFNTVSHKLLLNWLKYQFGITGCALSWIKSYLTKRSQMVVIDDLESDPMTLTPGVPQGQSLDQLCTPFSQVHWETCADHMVYCITGMLMIPKTTILSAQTHLEMGSPASTPSNVASKTSEYG